MIATDFTGRTVWPGDTIENDQGFLAVLVRAIDPDRIEIEWSGSGQHSIRQPIEWGLFVSDC